MPSLKEAMWEYLGHGLGGRLPQRVPFAIDHWALRGQGVNSKELLRGGRVWRSAAKNK